MWASLLLVLAGFAVPILIHLYIEAPSILQFIVQTIVDASKLEISAISITQCDESGFLLEMTAHISNTGPIPATIDSMVVSLYSSSGSSCSSGAREFARVLLPTLTATPDGCVCKVKDQRVEILDFDAFHTFNRNLVLQAELPLSIKGASSLSVAGLITSPITYSKTCILTGLDGVHITPLTTSKQSRSLLHGKPSEIEVDVIIASNSEVSIDMGTISVRILHEAMGRNIIIADLHARTFIRPGNNKVTLHGDINLADLAKHPLRSLSFFSKDVSKKENVDAMVIGTGAEQCKWLDRTVRVIKSPIEMESTLRSILSSVR